MSCFTNFLVQKHNLSSTGLLYHNVFLLNESCNLSLLLALVLFSTSYLVKRATSNPSTDFLKTMQFWIWQSGQRINFFFSCIRMVTSNKMVFFSFFSTEVVLGAFHGGRVLC